MNIQDQNKNCVAVIGAGPAGMQAAIAAANAGVDVALIDSNTQPGGQFYRRPPSHFQPRAADQYWDKADTLFAQLQHPRITLHLQTRVLDISTNGRKLWLHGPDVPTELEAEAIVLATGAYDRPAAFPGWTLPGVMSVGAAQTAIIGQRVLPGKNILLTGTGPLLLATGASLIWGGAQVAGVLESSTTIRRLPPQEWRALWGQWDRLRGGGRYLSALLRARVPYRIGWAVVEALGTPDEGVTGAVIAPLDEKWQPLMEKAQTIECDTVCIGYGFISETALTRLAGVEHIYQTALGGWVPVRDPFLQTTVHAVYVVGDGAGIGGAVQAELEGQLAGNVAASRLQAQSNSTDFWQRIRSIRKELDKQRAFQHLYRRLFTQQPGIHTWACADTILCRCESVNRAAVETAVELGAHTVTAVKDLTRAGMGSCQGRLCSHLIAGQIARITGKSIAACGQLSARAPVSPLSIADGAMQGQKS